LPVVKVRDFLVCMKKIITISCFSLPFFALFAILGSQTACQKQTTNCTAVITIDSAGGLPVSGATVKLYPPKGNLAEAEATGTTNSAGTVTFTFSLPAILNVAATKELSVSDTLHGSGVIQLQIGQTESTTVTIK
jgi:hypothetical protein